MTTDIPFNPITIPDGLLLSEETSPAQPPAPAPGAAQTKKPPRRRSRRKSKGPATPCIETADTTSWSSWQRIKGHLNARMAQMDPGTLKRILTAAGVSAGVILAIMIAIKLTPIGLALLAILGLAFVLRLWDRLL